MIAFVGQKTYNGFEKTEYKSAAAVSVGQTRAQPAQVSYHHTHRALTGHVPHCYYKSLLLQKQVNAQ